MHWVRMQNYIATLKQFVFFKFILCFINLSMLPAYLPIKFLLPQNNEKHDYTIPYIKKRLVHEQC